MSINTNTNTNSTNTNVLSPTRSIGSISGIHVTNPSNDNTIVNIHDNLNFNKHSHSPNSPNTHAFGSIPEGSGSVGEHGNGIGQEHGVDITTFMSNRNMNPKKLSPNQKQQQHANQHQNQHQKHNQNNQSNMNMNASKSHKEYTLNGWKEYAADKYGNKKFFQDTPTGKKCIETAAVAQYKTDMLALKKWADNVEDSATLLLDAFEQERSLVSAMRKKVKEI